MPRQKADELHDRPAEDDDCGEDPDATPRLRAALVGLMSRIEAVAGPSIRCNRDSRHLATLLDGAETRAPRALVHTCFGTLPE